MPRVDIPVTKITRTGVPAESGEVTADSTNNHSFVNDGRSFLYVRNADASPRTVTLVLATGNLDSEDGASPTITNPTVSVPATSSKIIGPFPRGAYGQVSDGDRVYINPENTLLRFRVYSIGQPV